MTWDQYWYGDVWMVKAFREAEKLRQEHFNAEAHLQGLYIYEALCDVSPVLQAFAKKGTKPLPYPAKPYSMDGKESKKEEDKEAQEEKERLQAKLYMQNMIWAGRNWGTKK